VTSTSENYTALRAKLKRIRICMFTTCDGTGRLTSHPMALQDAEDDGCLWFFTAAHTNLARDLPGNPAVNLSFAEPADSLYVSVSGRAELLNDRARIAQLWNPMVAAWFPEGLDDPELRLVKVDAHSAEFWDSKSSRMVQLMKMAQAALTGTPPTTEPGEHGKIQL
jgi:general stress protein 26